MPAFNAAKMTNAGSSARMFASTVVTLGCAFLLLMAAGIGVVVAITREANRLEAQRQGERIEAAVNAQIKLSELRLERLISAGDLSAFDAAGSRGCSGTPKTCRPVWTATTTSRWSLPAEAAAPSKKAGTCGCARIPRCAISTSP